MKNNMMIAAEMTNFDSVKNMILPGIRPVKDDTLFTIPFLDMEVWFYVRVADNAIGKITKGLADEWGVSSAEIKAAAVRNAREFITCSTMFDTLMDLGGEDAAGFFAPTPDEPYVLTNKKRHYCANVILDYEYMNKLCDRFGTERITVIPSSVHEVLTNVNAPVAVLNDMIKEVNMTVEEQDILSDHAYVFVKGIGLEIA